MTTAKHRREYENLLPAPDSLVPHAALKAVLAEIEAPPETPAWPYLAKKAQAHPGASRPPEKGHWDYAVGCYAGDGKRPQSSLEA